MDLSKLSLPAPALPPDPAIEQGLADSVAYLGSDAALRSLEIDAYWPKWHSPWWHVMLLYELGEVRRVPARIAETLAVRLDGLLHSFPIAPEELAGVNLQRDVACHCALGTMVPALAAAGVDVERALPWVRSWFERYQMADGGLNCDETAYRCADECPSSMVGTVPPLEAALLDPRANRAFVDRAAAFLIGRRLVRGSDTRHNADERESARAWGALCFPRFYFYDVLRGLAALVRWAEATGSEVPAEAVDGVVDALAARWTDGVVRVERRAYDGRNTALPTPDRSPSPRGPASTFPLLDAVSRIGAPSAALTLQWSEARAGLVRLADAGLLIR